MKLRLRLLAVAMVAVSLAPAGASAQSPVSDTGWDEKALSERPKGLSVPMFKTPRCPQWWDEARAAGFSGRDLKVLDYIMWRESRCMPRAHNTRLNADGSTDMGLTQINDRSWCLPSRYYKKGYLQTIGVLQYCEDLFNPQVNLLAAKALYDYSKQRGSGFQPWGVHIRGTSK